MEYKGKLYGKVGDSLIPLEATTEDFERFKALYLEGREVIEQLLSRFNEKQCKDTWDKKAVGYAKHFLTKHNVTPNRDGE